MIGEGSTARHVRAALTLAVALAAAPQVLAQAGPRAPRIGYAYPAGGRQGESFRIIVGGQFLDGAASAWVWGSGVSVSVVEHLKPINGGQAANLRDELKKLMDRKAAAAAPEAPNSATPAVWTPEDEKRFAEIRKQLDTFQRKPSAPAIVETVILQVTIAPDAEPGDRELRLGTALGLTNPLAFHVGLLPEFHEKDPKDLAANKKGAGKGFTGKKNVKAAPKAPPREVLQEITLPAVVNGRILPGEVDRFRFQARKGARIVAAASARRLIPYLPDAVPGWFQATLAIHDAKGRELAYSDDNRFHPDPVLCFEVPEDGEYVAAVKDSIYRGREDFVYRITIGEIPWVTGIFPLGGRAGEAARVELKGWNLPAAELTFDGKDRGPWFAALRVPGGSPAANPVSFALDALPEIGETEFADAPRSAQTVTLPVIVNGRIGRPEDIDVFRFEGRAGDEIVAEVQARRLDSPLDSFLELTDAVSRRIASNDDHEDKGAGLITHQADSFLRAALPTDGTYLLRLGDSQHKGGDEYAYRLRLCPPRPGFELRIVPSALNARAGMAIPVTVYALRRDGFAGEIALTLDGAPEGFFLGGARVPEGQDQVRVTLTPPPLPPEGPVALRLEGRATIQGVEVRRPVVPAEDMMQAFAYRHLVPAKELLVSVKGRAGPRSVLRIAGEGPVRIPAGGTALVKVRGPAGKAGTAWDLELDGAPEGISLGEAKAIRDGVEILLRSDAAKAKPGLKGNLIIKVMGQRGGGGKAVPKKAGAKTAQRPAPVGTLPAIPFEIVAP